MLLYIVEAKKGCKKKSLNILSLAAYLLKGSYKYTINDTQGLLQMWGNDIYFGIEKAFLGDTSLAYKGLGMFLLNSNVIYNPVNNCDHVEASNCDHVEARWTVDFLTRVWS